MAKGAYVNDRSVAKWRQSQENEFTTTARAERRAVKSSILSMRSKIIDKWWWDSLTNEERYNAHSYWIHFGYDEESLKKEIPGCLNTKRNLKLNEILK